ncbi:MAG: DciA family protein [Planctomycetota bacterium]
MHSRKDSIKALEETCARRARRDRDIGIAEIIKRTAQQAQRTRKQFGELWTVWEHLVPPHLAQCARLHRLHGTTLEVLVESAAVMYELDRLLRSGLTDEIRRAYRKGALNRVRLRLGSLTDDQDDARDRVDD